MLRTLFRKLINIIICSTCDLEIDGLEKIPEEEGCIIASNHIGRLDALLVYHLIKRDDIIMTIAEKYRKNPFFRLAAKSLDATWIDRFNPDYPAMRSILRKLDKGGILAIAPEGTRSEKGTLMAARQGTAFLAAKTQLPILPVGITGTEDRIVKERIKHLTKSKVTITVGNPFYLPPLLKYNRQNQLTLYTDEIMCQIAALLPPEYHGVYSTNLRIDKILENYGFHDCVT